MHAFYLSQKFIGQVFFIGIVLLLATVLRYTPPFQAEEEMIIPDGLEYAIGGLDLLQGKIPMLKTEDGIYPPRFFFGSSLLIAPFYLLIGRQLGNAIYASLFFGLLSLILLYLISKKLFGPTAALFSLVVMTISPLHHYLSVIIHSDIAFLVVVLLAILYYLDGSISFGYGFLLGILVGFSVWVRYQGVTLIPLFILVFLIDRNAKPLEKMKCISGFLLSVCMWLIPMGLYHYFRFGNIFHTGYQFWLSDRWQHWERLFSWKFAFLKAGSGGEEGNAIHYLKLMLGWNKEIFAPAYPFPIFLLSLWAILRIKREGLEVQRKFLSLSLMCLGIFLIFAVPFLGQADRYLILPISLVVILSGSGANFLLQKVGKNGKMVLGSSAFFYILFVIFHFPPPSFNRAFPIRNLVFLLGDVEEKKSVISGLDPVSFEYYFGSKRTVRYLPVSNAIEYINKHFPSKKERTPFQNIGSLPEEYLRRVKKGEVLYLESYFSRFYRSSYKTLWRYCHVQRDQKKGCVSLYRLSKLDGI